MFLLSCLLLLVASSATLTFNQVPLVSRKLCNNDPDDILPQKCYNSQYGKEVECDPRKTKYCSQVNSTVVLSANFLNELGKFVDNDSSVRRVTLDLSKTKIV